MIENRGVEINEDIDGKKLIFINDDVRFALPVYIGEKVERYNIYTARLLVNHAENGKSICMTFLQ